MFDFSVDGNPDGMFSIDRFSLDGVNVERVRHTVTLRLAKPLDHEQRNHYTVGLQVILYFEHGKAYRLKAQIMSEDFIFLARLDIVQEELMYYPRSRRRCWR